MEILDRLGAAPRRLSAPQAAALGLALGFYPRPGACSALLAAAIALAGLGLALRGLARLAGEGEGSPSPSCPGREAEGRGGSWAAGGAGARAWARLALACAAGLAAGAGLARDDAARSAFAASSLFAPRPALPRGGPGPSPAAARRGLSLAALEGSLSADSSPASGGFRSYLVAVSRIALSGEALRGELSFPRGSPGELRVLARGGPALDAGARARFALRPAAGGGSRGASGAPVLFAAGPGVAALEPGGPVDRARSTLRGAFRSALARAGGAQAGLLEALLLGSREGLEAEVAGAFKAAGCSHVLALSGQHLSVLALLVVSLLRPLCGPRRARACAAAAAGAFMWLAGPGPSLLRAVLMTCLGALALALDRPQRWLGLLALAFLVALPLDPGSARSLGFLLSYLAVWGLAVLGPRFQHLLSPALPPLLCSAAAASLAAQAATSPLLAFAFGSLQPAGILASMASAPLVTAAMWWGMGAGALCAIAPGAAPLASRVSELLGGALVGVMRAAALSPPILLPGPAARAGAAAAVALAAAWVYAYPWLAYRRAIHPRRLSRPPAARAWLGERAPERSPSGHRDGAPRGGASRA
ncbi:MAG TPA: ComEC/Rec2 family competence protein [Spirochaetia bacterium]|nr:ComEC/Rec2 family competence protein [Spirochaetia bacterium]